jgi:hypothetical protein
MPNTLSKSIRSESKYKLGGISTLLVWATKTASGIPQASVDPLTKAFTLAPAATVFRLEFEENSCLYSDNTTIGTNIYPKHIVGMKFAGRTQDLNDAAKAFDLSRHTFAARTFTGEYVVLGLSNGLKSEKNDSGAGATTDDFNGFDTVVSGGEVEKATIIAEADFLALAGRVTV